MTALRGGLFSFPRIELQGQGAKKPPGVAPGGFWNQGRAAYGYSEGNANGSKNEMVHSTAASSENDMMSE